jgi:hypothetical protein
MTAVLGSCLVVVMLALYALLAIRPVTIDVYPHLAFAPADVRVTVRVQPNAENRGLVVEADGTMYRSSFFQLDGADAPITFQINWPALTAGEYDVRAAVSSRVRVLARDRTTLKVVGAE